MQGGIKIKTMQNYSKDIKMFITYLEGRGAKAKVRNYLLDPTEGTPHSIQKQAGELACYAKWLSQNASLCPSAFDDQFYAIRRLMLNNLRDISVFDVECVKEARRIARDIVASNRKRAIEAFEPLERAAYDAKYGLKVPFTEEMMTAHRVTFFSNPDASIEEKMAYMATAVGYHFGNRPSEECSSGPLPMNSKGEKDEDHRYIVEDIQYQLDDGSFITGPDITEDNKKEIQFISVMVHSHKGETIKIRQTKGTTKRQPNSIRNDNGDMELQLFNDLIEWPGLASLQHGDFFFSRNKKGRNLQLTKKAMVETMKTTAAKQGVDSNLISAKSLRKALGTDLTRSNVPKESRNKIGRWTARSDTCTTAYAMATAGEVTGTMSQAVTRTSNNDLLRFNRTRDKFTSLTHKTTTQGIGVERDGLASPTEWGGTRPGNIESRAGESTTCIARNNPSEASARL